MAINGRFYTLLPATAITTAVTGVAGAMAGGGSDLTLIGADYIALQAVFTYGSGGTNATVYVQTSLDEGTIWIDVASFQFLLASATKISALSGAIAPTAQAFAPTDGALAANTVVQGVFGDLWRTKLTTTGVYAATTIAISMVAKS